MRKQYFRAVAAGVAGLLGTFAVVPSPAQIRDLTLTIDEYQGILGTDSTGRRNICGHLQKFFPAASDSRRRLLTSPQTKEDVALACEGYHVKTIVLVVSNWSSDFRALRSDALLKEIFGKPYGAVVDALDGLVLRYGAKEPAGAGEIKAKLQEMGAKSVRDLLYACGFERLIVRDRATQLDYTKQGLSGLGSSPFTLE
jgi:hypothetical protein